MKTYLKPTVLAVGIMAAGLITSVNARVPRAPRAPILNFQLEVVGKDRAKIINPRIILTDSSSLAEKSGENRFAMQLTQNDASEFYIEYVFDGQQKKVMCTIGGMPQRMTATIDPASNSCATQN